MSQRFLRDPRVLTRTPTVAVLLAAVAAFTPVGRAHATAPSPPSPRLRLSWAVSRHRCWTAIERVRVRHGNKVSTSGAFAAAGTIRQGPRTGSASAVAANEAFGHLTIGKQPIPNAPITLSWTIPDWQTGTNVVATNAHGRFTMLIPGPSKILTISCSPSPGQLIAITKRVEAAASVSLHISALRAGRRAHFYGVVRGGLHPREPVTSSFGTWRARQAGRIGEQAEQLMLDPGMGHARAPGPPSARREQPRGRTL